MVWANDIAMRRTRVRVVLLGDFRVGKTSLVRQFLDHRFSEAPSNTVTEDERTSLLTVGGSEVELLLTDTAGQEQFRSFTSSYFREKDGFVVVFSVADAASFRNVAHWVTEIRAWDEQYRLVLVGNKIDVEDRVVSTREAEDLCKTLSARGSVVYVETSAKLNVNCNKAFEEIVRLCLPKPEVKAPTTAPGVVHLGNSEQQPLMNRPQSNFTCCK